MEARPAVLIVDDEAPIRETVRELLARRLPAIDIITAADASAAIAVLSRRPIDVMITDHRMPGMSGLELVSEVARRWPRTRRIMMTAYADIGLTIDAINSGHVTAFQKKPINAHELVRAVAEQLEQLRRERERMMELARSLDAWRLAGPGARS